MRLIRLCVVACAAFLLAACGDNPPASQNSPTATTTTNNEAELTAWADQVCGAVLDMVNAVSTEPQLDDSDLALIKQQFSAWLGTASAKTGESITRLEGLRDGPHEDSEKVVTAALEPLTQLKTALDTAKADVDGADPANPEAFATTMEKVSKDMDAVAAANDDVGDIMVGTKLAEAEKNAANCQKLNAMDPAATTTTTS